MMATLVPEPNENWASNGATFSVSPNGRRVVIRSGDTLVIRSVDSLSSQRVPNSADATYPFWSPDGRSIGFFAEKHLKTIDLSTGAVRALCPAAAPMGGSWAFDGTILFAPDRSAGLQMTTASGGKCEKLNMAQPPASLGARPYFFPDGKHFIATTDLAAYLGKLGGDSLRRLVRLPRMRAVFAAPHFLLYEPEGSPGTSIFAQRIDVRARTLVGDPVKVLERVPHAGGNTSLSASSNGVLVARVGRDQGRRFIARVMRGGGTRDTADLGLSTFGAFRRSRDGRRLAVGGFRLELLDLDRLATSTLIKPTPNRLLSQYPQWSPNDTAIAYLFRDSVNARIDVINVQTGVAHTLVSGFPTGRFPYPGDWSPDGRYIVYALAAGGSDVQEGWIYDLSTKQSRKLLEERDVGAMQISPNGKFIAYEVGGGEVYVRAFPGPGLPVRVTAGVARSPHWRGDGRELFYVDASGAIMAAGIRENGTVAPMQEVAVPSSTTRPLTSNTPSIAFAPSIDGKQFHLLYNSPPNYPGLAILTNWWQRAGLTPNGRHSP
jgi:hypothetical protein